MEGEGDLRHYRDSIDEGFDSSWFPPVKSTPDKGKAKEVVPIDGDGDSVREIVGPCLDGSCLCIANGGLEMPTSEGNPQTLPLL